MHVLGLIDSEEQRLDPDEHDTRMMGAMRILDGVLQ